MRELTRGETYQVKLTVTNQSTKAGVPVGATLGVGIFAMAGVMLIPKRVDQEYFGPGQTREFTYSMTVTEEASGPGAITAWVEDPSGKEIAKAIADILVTPYLVDFSGRVTDAETLEPLADVTVEMWNEDKTELLDSTTTDSSGNYVIRDIPVPITVVFMYKKEGYEDTVTIPIYLDPSGGGLDVELVPLVPTQLVLYYTNPRDAGATHWNIYDLDTDTWLAGGLPKLMSEAIVFTPVTNRLFAVFREARNAFFDVADYGPYVVEGIELGEYTWDARAAKLNGVSAIKLMGKSGDIRGMVINQTETNVPGVYRLAINVLEAETAPGKYFLGKTIIADESEIRGNLVGVEIAGTLRIQSWSLGEYPYYPGFAMVIDNITFPSGVPDDYYELGGGYVAGYNRNGSLRSVGISYFSKYGYHGIPIRFEAWQGDSQRSLIFLGGRTYEVGDYGTEAVEKILPSYEDEDDPYWLDLVNLDGRDAYGPIGYPNIRYEVYLGTPEGEWVHVATISSPYEQ